MATAYPQSDEERDELIRDMARNLYHDEGAVEIDDCSAVSEGSDNGAYVQAWVWVSFTGTLLDKENEDV